MSGAREEERARGTGRPAADHCHVERALHTRARFYHALACGIALLALGCGDADGSFTGSAPHSPRWPVEAAPEGMIAVPGGVARFGADEGPDIERPSFRETIAPFHLDRAPVSVADFARFVRAHRYTTRAERDGSAAVFDLEHARWGLVPGARWDRPLGSEGPRATDDHPVTQVAWEDADAYCRARDARLPTELEWERAARWGGGVSAEGEDGAWRANVWQGAFPETNTLDDAHLLSSPIGSFAPSALGFVDLIGNVWQWTSSWLVPWSDRARPFEPGPGSQRVIRGGSFLCDARVCHGYRATARQGATPESALFHVGFRCARDAR